MPAFRGIRFTVFTKADSKEFQECPEFPHPDASSVHLRGASPPTKGGMLSPRPPISLTDIASDSDRPHKLNPKISVYIASEPGAQFSFTYKVDTLPCSPQPKYAYFKAFMNGRHMVSWGIELKKKDKTAGIVSRALYEPSDRWHYKENGVVMKRDGIEARYFQFTPGSSRSIAEDGGLIEFQVYRAQSRKRRVPELDRFRGHSNGGINAPTAGLLDRPEDLDFYYYHLTDPKDAPYAVFRFYYRSETNLNFLSLIPSSHEFPCGSLSYPRRATDRRSAHGNDITPAQKKPDRKASCDPDESLDDAVFGGDSADASLGGEKAAPRSQGGYVLKSPPQLLPAPSQNRRLPQPSKALRDGSSAVNFQRPLPEVPVIPEEDASVQSRRSSAASRTPSITPSLLPYVDDDSFITGEVTVGVAQVFRKTVEKPLPEPPVKDTSISDYGDSPPSTDPSNSPQVPTSPQKYLATTGSLLERHFTSFMSPRRQQESPSRGGRSPTGKQVRGETDGDDGDGDLPKVGPLSLSEQEWMRRTPSPLRRRKAAGSPLSRLWSPRSESKKLTKSFFGRSPRKEERGDDSDVPGSAQHVMPQSPVRNEIYDETDNWI